MNKKKSKTNDTTRAILKYLFVHGIFAWRQNVAAIPLDGGGFRSGSKAGIPDILGILSPGGQFFGIEIKTGTDSLRPEQIGFHTTAKRMGAIILVVKDYEDFITQWEK